MDASLSTTSIRGGDEGNRVFTIIAVKSFVYEVEKVISPAKNRPKSFRIILERGIGLSIFSTANIVYFAKISSPAIKLCRYCNQIVIFAGLREGDGKKQSAGDATHDTTRRRGSYMSNYCFPDRFISYE